MINLETFKNNLEKIVVIDYIPIKKENIDKLNDFIRNYHGDENLISFDEFNNNKIDLRIRAHYPIKINIGNQSDLTDFENVTLNIIQQLGVGITLIFEGEVDTNYTTKKFIHLEHNLQSFVINNELINGVLSNNNLGEKFLPSIWYYDFSSIIRADNSNDWVTYFRKWDENNAQYVTDLRYIGWSHKEPDFYSTIIDKKYIVAPGDRYSHFNTFFGNIRYRYLLLQQKESTEWGTDIFRDAPMLEIAKHFLPACWSIFLYCKLNGLNSTPWKIESDEDVNLITEEDVKNLIPDTELSDIRSKYSNQILHKKNFDDESREAKNEINALHRIIEKKGGFTDEDDGNNNKEQLISQELLSNGEEYIFLLQQSIRYVSEIHTQNIKTLDNIFDLKTTTSNLKLQGSMLILTCVIIVLSLTNVSIIILNNIEVFEWGYESIYNFIIMLNKIMSILF